MLFIWLLKWCCCSATADVSFGAAAVEHHRPALGSPLQTSHYSCTSCYLQCTKFSNIGFWKAPPLVNEKLPFFIRCIMITGLPKDFDQLCISETAPVLAWLGFPITHGKGLDFSLLNFWLLIAKGQFTTFLQLYRLRLLNLGIYYSLLNNTNTVIQICFDCWENQQRIRSEPLRKI